MSDTPLPVERILAHLEAAPARLAAITRGVPAAQLAASPAPGQWSARDVLAHLRACADMWGQAIDLILSADKPTFKAVNPGTWIKQTNYRDLAFRLSLRAYTAQRAALLAVLKPLRPAAWARTATVTGAGKPIVRSVYSYAQWLATHERSHIKQIERLAAHAQA
jgi:hypothetical protein